MKQKLVMGNWKMNGQKQTVQQLIQDLLELMPQSNASTVVVFPPSIYLPLTEHHLQGSAISWGSQNVYICDAGAFTGEISAAMACDYGCQYVLVGHSERRRLFHEDEKFVAEKFHHVKDHDMIPVLCIGETLEERKQGLTEQVLAQQLLAVAQTEKMVFQGCVIAYEPVWAIGTGQTPSPEEIQAVHAFLRTLLVDHSGLNAAKVPILYGGSVNEKNANLLFAIPDVDGGLIGGASLNAQQFVEIVKCINLF